MFVTEPGPFTELVAGAVAEVTGRKPELSTTGGTSDARFIKDYCPVVEFGLVGQTMHAIDERVPVADLRALTAIYRKILDRYFDASIIHPHQIEPVRRRDLAAGGAVARGERAREIVGAPFALADHAPASRPSSAPGCAGTSAPTAMTCTSSPCALDVEPVERLHRRIGLAFGGAEGGEVVLADQPLRGGVHRRGIERARHAPGAAARRASRSARRLTMR